MRRKILVVVTLLLLVSMMLPAAAGAQDINTGADQPTVRTSHRLIVELTSPPLVQYAAQTKNAIPAGSDGHLNVSAPASQNYINRLVAEQQAFVNQMTQAMPSAHVATYMDETGQTHPATYQLLLNAVAVDAGRNADEATLLGQLRSLPDVKHVYRDYAHDPDLYASVPLINAPAAWNNAVIGGQANAGKGIKFASMDGGVHHDAAMFSGSGYSYPPGYPKGDTRNTNGKIIVSRAYFRTWDPPSPGDENTWPGTQGTPHGVHTASTAAGEQVTASYLGITQTISGVAPQAYVMSYRVFYNSVTNDGSFYTVEALRALEDIVADGADVLNNSWGGGPTSLGGEFDALDQALINTWDAGVFVSMSNGNAGPDLGTGDHPSSEYINVAASTTSGTFASGRFNVSAPTPVSNTLQGVPFGTAEFGEALQPAQVYGPYGYAPTVVVAPTDQDGCSPFPAGTFTGKAAMIERGTCNFSIKVYNAQEAGASFVVVYNNAANGDTLINMAAGTDAELVTIPSISVGRTDGLAIINWYNLHPSDAQFTLDTLAYQVGNTPDIIADFSSRGPGVGNVLKPDIAAPGVNILAQGFAVGEGEARHLGWGQASGTSMAAPHVAGAAILLKQIHPTWSPEWIKSALMSTSKYMDIYVDADRTTPAQPLDMGAGRLDLTNAADPGVILDPPSLSFGQVISGTTGEVSVTVTSVAKTTETYVISTLYTGRSFTETTSVPGLAVYTAPPATRGTVAPAITLQPGQSTTLYFEWNTADAGDYSDHQGYVVLTGSKHQAHMPAWMRTAHEPAPASVLVIENDGASSEGYMSYVGYYTQTLESMGLPYQIWDADAHAGSNETIPDATDLAQYPVIIYETGDWYEPNGSYTVPTPLTTPDMDHLVEYVNNGGALISFGQDIASIMGAATYPPDGNAPVLYSSIMGATWVQDTINHEYVYTDTPQVITGLPGSPFDNMSFDVSAMGDGAGNQRYIDEIDSIIGANCDGPDTADLCRDQFRLLMKYASASHIREGYVGLSHRDQPSLERPGITLKGRSLYFSFGLEGVNNNTGYVDREALMWQAMQWVLDRPMMRVNSEINAPGAVSYFEASMRGGGPAMPGVQAPDTKGQSATYRWDFGDGTPITPAYSSATAGHTYQQPGRYHVRVEGTDFLGTRAISEFDVVVTTNLYLPLLSGPTLDTNS
jgi:hypothetical protein